MQSIKIQCPAKINLLLKVLNKREDGFHNIESIMQTIDLFDYLTINIENYSTSEILLDGNNKEIPYNEKNLVYKAAKLFLDKTNLQNKKISIYIDKSIPVSAGLAGGSTNAAGTLYGLNKIFKDILTRDELNYLCAGLGSDLNVCLNGGRILATGRGEVTEPLEFEEFNVNLIKPKALGISAKEAYTKFAELKNNSKALKTRDNFENDLEWAVIEDYPQLQFIKNKYPKSMMTGSGSTYFSLTEEFEQEDGYWIQNGLKAIPFGVRVLATNNDKVSETYNNKKRGEII